MSFTGQEHARAAVELASLHSPAWGRRAAPLPIGPLCSAADPSTRSSQRQKPVMLLAAAPATAAPPAPALACRPARSTAVVHARGRACRRVAAGKQPESGYFSEADPSGERAGLGPLPHDCSSSHMRLGGCRTCISWPALRLGTAPPLPPAPLHHPTPLPARLAPRSRGAARQERDVGGCDQARRALGVGLHLEQGAGPGAGVGRRGAAPVLEAASWAPC